MKRSFIFPGQGSQTVGMAKEFYDNFAIAKQVFKEVDDILDRDLSKIIFEGPEEVLTNTENSQPAIMTVSIAILEVLKKETGFEIDRLCNAVAGHSLGEYVALYASESLNLKDVTELLRIRGRAFAEAGIESPGLMAALVGATIEQAEDVVEKSKISGEVLQIANDNTVGQVVISGSVNSIERAIEFATQVGIKKAIKLQVSGAFHSALMLPAVEKMQNTLEQIEIKEPKVSIIANYTAKPEVKTEIKDNLIKQITGRVRWRETMLNMQSSGIEIFVEIGNGKVLSGMVPRTCPDIETFNLNSIANLKMFIDSIGNN
jgi:[acyl-carrier-protein] S-malonyltransferase